MKLQYSWIKASPLYVRYHPRSTWSTLHELGNEEVNEEKNILLKVGNHISYHIALVKFGCLVCHRICFADSVRGTQVSSWVRERES